MHEAGVGIAVPLAYAAISPSAPVTYVNIHIYIYIYIYISISTSHLHRYCLSTNRTYGRTRKSVLSNFEFSSYTTEFVIFPPLACVKVFSVWDGDSVLLVV